MRHFLRKTSPIAVLTVRVTPSPVPALLVLAPGPLPRLAASELAALALTVDLAAITGAADRHLAATTSAAEQAMRWPDRDPRSSGFWTSPTAIAILPLQTQRPDGTRSARGTRVWQERAGPPPITPPR
jgi:hypothetical protein